MKTFEQYISEEEQQLGKLGEPVSAGTTQVTGARQAPRPDRPGASTPPETEAKPFLDQITQAVQGGQISPQGFSYLVDELVRIKETARQPEIGQQPEQGT